MHVCIMSGPHGGYKEDAGTSMPKASSADRMDELAY